MHQINKLTRGMPERLAVKVSGLCALLVASLVFGGHMAPAATILVNDNFENGSNNDGSGNSDFFTPNVGSLARTGYNVAYAGSKAALLRSSSGISLINPLALSAGGYASVDIQFQLMFGQGTRAPGAGEGLQVFYSAMGNFSDSVLLTTLPVANNGSWNLQTITITNESGADSNPLTVVFTDTAKIRFVTLADGSSEWTHIDNAVITGNAVPEPSTLILIGMAATAVVLRRRRV